METNQSGMTERKGTAKQAGKGGLLNPKKAGHGLLLGAAVSLTMTLHPILIFYLHNEGEFWFPLSSVLGPVLILFAAAALLIALGYCLLPGRRKRSPRLFYAALFTAVCLCFYIQSNWMVSYLPVLTGDPIDWSLYPAWGAGSLALWIAVPAAMLLWAWLRPRSAKKGIFVILPMLLAMEVLTGGWTLLTAERAENKKASAFFSTEGLYETAEAGNVIVLISDTFEGSYMNEVLERYPEYRELLDDFTYYDNVTGTSCFTYFSYAKLMTGVDFPIGMNSKQGIQYCFDHQTLMDRILANGWDIAYYTTFSPTQSIAGKVSNYAEGQLTPSSEGSWQLTRNLLKSALYQGAPQQIKDWFAVYTQDYDRLKKYADKGPYYEDDPLFYERLTSDGLRAVDGPARYKIVQLWGVHEPAVMNADFQPVGFDDSVPYHERKIQGARAQLKLLREFSDRLKAAGTYDQTTLILTADHGFDLRFYPVFLVKEAGREESGFTVDHAPLSMEEDFEPLMEAVTGGARFSEAVSALNLTEDRLRRAVDFRSTSGYAKTTNRMSTVLIQGDASEEASYRVERDTFLLKEDFSGRYTLGKRFIQNGKAKKTAAVYGMYKGEGVNGRLFGHTAVADIFFEETQRGALMLEVTLRSVLEETQRLEVAAEGETLLADTLAPGEKKTVQVYLPAAERDRLTVELNFPDAKLIPITGETLQWNSYNSAVVEEARIKAAPD